MMRFNLASGLIRSLNVSNQVRCFQTTSNLLKAAGAAKKTRAFKRVTTRVEVKGPGVEDFDASTWSIKKLSNPTLKAFDLDNTTTANIGSVLSLPSETIGNFDSTKVPKHLNKQFQLLQPALLLRQNFFDVQTLVQEQYASSSKLPIIIDGESGSGKSSLLLQTIANARQSADTVVIYSPNTNKWINGSQAYKYDTATKTFSQSELTSQFLKEILECNSEILDNIQLDKDLAFGKTKLAKGSSLSQLLTVGSKDRDISHQVFNQFLDILSAQNNVNVLIAIDEVNILYGESAYYNPDNQVLKANQSQFVSQFTDIIEGKRKFKKGCFIGATSWVDILHRSQEFGTFVTKDHTSSPKATTSASGIKFTRFIPAFYTLAEAMSVAKFHKDCDSYFEELDDQSVYKKHLITHGNPKKFSEACKTKL